MEEGSFYHIYNRGNNKQPIFFERKNYHYFLNQFDKYLSAFLDIYAYCLMPNHFHFLAKIIEYAERNQTSEVFGNFGSLGTPKLKPIEKAFKNFFISYAKSINSVYDRTGSLFQSKFKKKEITNDGYFTSIIQYIHANPIAAGLCKSYGDWEFSSYNAIIGTQPTKVKREEVIEWFGSREIFIKVHQERKLEREDIRSYLFD